MKPAPVLRAAQPGELRSLQALVQKEATALVGRQGTRGMMQYEEDLAVTVTSNVDPVLIAVAGEMDAFTRSRLIRVLARVLTRDVNGVIVDVSGLSFIDATSYAALMDLTRQARSEGRTVVFRSPSRAFLRARELIDEDLDLDIE